MKSNKLIGDKNFYKAVLAIAVPIMVQTGITNFVNMLDNIMVGRVGTEEMSAVSIVNQLIFIYNLCIFGGFSGAGIFTAQYSGAGDDDGVRQTCRFKIKLGIALTVAAFIVFALWGKNLISLYLNEGSDGDLVKTLDCALSYLKVAVWGLPFFALVQAYGSTLRECGETVAPMKAGFLAFFVNMFFNWLLIYGNLGCPVMGVVGAAVATVISRIVEMLFIVLWTTRHTSSFVFARGLLSSLATDKALSSEICKVGSPLLLNETLWSAGMAFLTQCYSMRGLESVAGFNIASILVNVFKVVFLAMGNTVGIVVGRHLGSGDTENAVDASRKLTVFSVFLCLFVGALMFSVSGLFPKIYNTSVNSRNIATQAIIVAAIFMPLDAYKNATYFTLRSGGRTWVTFLFDSAYLWVVSCSVAFILSRYTSLASVNIFVAYNLAEIPKACVGFILVKKRIWLRTITV